jgi:hypothetical protein
VLEFLSLANQMSAADNLDEAMLAVIKLLLVDPRHAEALQLQLQLKSKQKEMLVHRVHASTNGQRESRMQALERVLERASGDGEVGSAEQAIIDNFRQSLQLADEEHPSPEHHATGVEEDAVAE